MNERSLEQIVEAYLQSEFGFMRGISEAVHFISSAVPNSTPIKQCVGYSDLSMRARKVLYRADVLTLASLCRKTSEQLSQEKECGSRTISEIRDFVSKNGASLLGG